MGTSILLSLTQTDNHRAAVLKFLQQTEAAAAINPDLHFLNSDDEPLQIAQVRQLSLDLLSPPYQGEQNIFVILHIDQASLPAQNALLKSLEEPPAHAQIILTTARLEQVLPTIKSRCIQQNIQIDQAKKPTLEATELTYDQLQTSSYSQIFALSETYKDRTAAKKLLEGIIFDLHQQNQKKPQADLVHALQAALVTQDLLEKNINVRLALEDFFLQLKSTQTL